MTQADPPLHHQILQRVAGVHQTLHLVGVSGVPLICLDPLARVKEVMQDLIKDLDVGVLTCRVLGTLDSHQVPPQNAHPQLVVEGGLASALVGSKGVPL